MHCMNMSGVVSHVQLILVADSVEILEPTNAALPNYLLKVVSTQLLSARNLFDLPKDVEEKAILLDFEGIEGTFMQDYNR